MKINRMLKRAAQARDLREFLQQVLRPGDVRQKVDLDTLSDKEVPELAKT